jgi:SynChlorMet cassette radical SAM/SPASM protein ScmE
MHMRLAGGEPFYRKDLKELIDGVVRNRMRFSMLSNGGLITEEIAEYIASTGRCDSIQISLDGGSAEVHDKARGKGSFDAAVQGIKLLKKCGIPVKIRCTIHRYNFEHLKEVAAFVLDELEIVNFSTNSAGYFGVCQSNTEDLMLSAEERSAVMATLDSLDRKYPGRITASAGPLSELKMWKRMEEDKKLHRPKYSNTGSLTGCGCHKVELSVRSDGHYTVCSMLSGMTLGKINQDNLLDVWRNNATLCAFRNRPNIELKSFDYCRECDFADYCTGNCPAIAYEMTGDVHQPAPEACYRLFLEHGGKLPEQKK